MRVVVLVVGRARGTLADAVTEYERRAGRYWKLEVVEVDDGVKGGMRDPARVMEAEGERILARLPAGLDVVALTPDGRTATSEALSRDLQDAAVSAHPGFVFVIGGAHGLDRRVLERAARRLSLSPMTFPHDMARLVLAEQLYRAGTIARGEPYHKG